MEADEQILAEACRLEHDEQTGDLFIVFKVSSEKYKKFILAEWTNEIEFFVKNKKLIAKE